MPKDYAKEAFQEHTDREAIRRWYQARVEAVRRAVTAHDVLRRNGVVLRYAGSDREEQFGCPFHGIDRHPSARVYPETVKGPSHVWCFVCQENWDSIGLWKKYAGSDIKFTRVLADIERSFGLIPPEKPPSAAELADFVDPETLEVEKVLDACESGLKHAKQYFDLKGHLLLGSILDRVRYHFERATMPPQKARDTAEQILAKIVAKERACPGG